MEAYMAASPVKTIVHTLGDSTLDNLFWLIDKNGTNLEEAKKASVEGQLQTLSGYEVISHAYDGFTAKSILDGDTVGKVLPSNGNAKKAYLNAKGAGGAAGGAPAGGAGAGPGGRPRGGRERGSAAN